MRQWMDLFESRKDRKWETAQYDAIEGVMPVRFQKFRDEGMEPHGEFTDIQGRTVVVWSGETEFSNGTEKRFYASIGDEAVGFLRLDEMVEDAYDVGMVYVHRKEQRSGIGIGLYRYAISTGIKVLSGKTMTRQAISLWRALLTTPEVEVSIYEFDRFTDEFEREIPCTKVEQVFQSRKERRLCAKTK